MLTQMKSKLRSSHRAQPLPHSLIITAVEAEPAAVEAEPVVAPQAIDATQVHLVAQAPQPSPQKMCR